MEEFETSTVFKWQPDDYDTKWIYYSKSTDGGFTWSAPALLDTYTGRSEARSLDIDVGKNDVVHVAYGTHSPSLIKYQQSTDGGSTWSTAMTIGNDRDRARPTVISADNNGNVYVAFHAWNFNVDTGDIQFVRSTDGGSTWSSEVTLVGGYGWATSAQITSTNSGDVYLSYSDNKDIGVNQWTDPRDIYIKASTDYGATWGTSIRLTSTSASSLWPHSAVDSSGDIHMVWMDARDGNWEIYYTKLDSTGSTLVDDTRLTDNQGDSGAVEIAVDSTDTNQVVWRNVVIEPVDFQQAILDYIFDLPDWAFKNNAENRKNTLKSKFEAVMEQIDNEKYDSAIKKLKNDIRSKMDGSVDGNPNNDWITDPAAQQDLCDAIDWLIEYLEYLNGDGPEPDLSDFPLAYELNSEIFYMYS
jgi:hypothetical protein